MNELKAVVNNRAVLVMLIVLILSGCSSEPKSNTDVASVNSEVDEISPIELLEAEVIALNDSLEVQAELLFELNRKVAELDQDDVAKSYEVKSDSEVSELERKVSSDIESLERKVSMLESELDRIVNLEMELSLLRMYIDKDINIHEVRGFVTVTDVETRTIGFDDVEWVSMEDVERIEQLGMNAEKDFPNGFNLFNENEGFTSIEIDETVEVYTLLNPSSYNRVFLEELEQLLEGYYENQLFCTLIMDGDDVVAIIESYLP